MDHNVGNYYKLLGHIIKLEDFVTGGRCKLSCDSGCCTRGHYGSPGLVVECLHGDLDEMELVKEAGSKSEVDWQKGDTAQVKTGWDKAGTRFTVLGPAVFLGQWWVPIEDPDEEYPDFFKEAGLKRVEKNENNN